MFVNFSVSKIFDHTKSHLDFCIKSYLTGVTCELSNWYSIANMYFGYAEKTRKLAERYAGEYVGILQRYI